MVTKHVLQRIEERRIEIDLEMIEYFCKKYNSQDTAVLLGEVQFLGEENYVILIIRNGNAIAIEFRRCSQNNDAKSLKVDSVIAFPCLF